MLVSGPHPHPFFNRYYNKLYQREKNEGKINMLKENWIVR